MRYTISKDFTFDAAHHLHDLPDGHKCARVHGHTYRVRVVLGADHLDPRGFVLDYGDLAPLKRYIDDNLDHRDLNTLLDQPTAELLARHLLTVVELHGWPAIKVGVSETPNTWAWCRA